MKKRCLMFTLIFILLTVIFFGCSNIIDAPDKETKVEGKETTIITLDPDEIQKPGGQSIGIPIIIRVVPAE